jgi:hypothetical protein
LKALAQDLTIDYLYLVVLIIYGINFIIGKNNNEAIANAWMYEVEPIINNSFSIHSGIQKESQYQYNLVAAGKGKCLGLHASLAVSQQQQQQQQQQFI